MIIPLVPPAAASVAAGAVGRVPVEVVGTEKDIRHPVVSVQLTGLAVELDDSTLKNIKSVPVALNTSVRGEQVVLAVETASTLVPLVAMTLAVIGIW